MAGRKKTYYDHFDHPTNLYNSNAIMALNIRFPRLSGYGVFCYLMELCARNISGSISFSIKDQQEIAAMMNIPQEEFVAIITYLDKVAAQITIAKVSGELQLKVDILDRQQKRKKVIRQASRQRMAEKRYQLQKKHGVRVDIKETAMGKRKRIWKEFDQILILTDRIINDASLKYPHLGAIRVYFEEFKKWVKIHHKETWGQVTHDNYVTAFYMHLNQYKKPLREALLEDGRPYEEIKNSTRTAINFHID